MKSSVINLKNKIIIDAEPKDDKIEILFNNGKRIQISNTTENADKIFDRVLKQEQFRFKMEKAKLNMPFTLPFYFLLASIALIPLGVAFWGSIGAVSMLAFLIGAKVITNKIANKMFNTSQKMLHIDLAVFQKKLLKNNSFEKTKKSDMEQDLSKNKNGKVLDMIAKLEEAKKQLAALSDDGNKKDSRYGKIVPFENDRKIK